MSVFRVAIEPGPQVTTGLGNPVKLEHEVFYFSVESTNHAILAKGFIRRDDLPNVHPTLLGLPSDHLVQVCITARKYKDVDVLDEESPKPRIGSGSHESA